MNFIIPKSRNGTTHFVAILYLVNFDLFGHTVVSHYYDV